MSNDTSPNPRAGSRRFWVAVLCFSILNVAAWVAYDRCYAWRHRGTLRVDAFEPGDESVVGPRDQFRWHFSADVIPTSVYHADPGSVAPAVAGHWGWDDPPHAAFHTRQRSAAGHEGDIHFGDGAAASSTGRA